jgi:hypothetical protein
MTSTVRAMAELRLIFFGSARVARCPEYRDEEGRLKY